MKKKCVWCGKEFEAKNWKAQSCGDDHYAPCPDCGTPVLIKEKSYSNFLKDGPRRCFKCRNKAIGQSHKNRSEQEKEESKRKARETNRARYGADYGMQSQIIKDKAKETIKKKYGVENLSQSAEIQNKIRQNSLAKYGVDHYSKDSEIRSRMKSGMISKYGAATPMQVEELKHKIEDTNLKKYGSKNVLGSKEIQKRIESTCLSKYGVKHAASAQEVIDRRRKTNMEKYGAPGIVFSDEFLAQQIRDPSKKSEYLLFKRNPETYILSNFSDKPTLKNVSEKIGLSEGQIAETLKHHNCYDLVQHYVSTMENEVIEYLKTIVDDDKICVHNRSAIKPLEIDIYLPEYNFGIECNPTASHNSTIHVYASSEMPLSPSYHKKKSEMAANSGIFLLHIFGYEWENKKDIILSMIGNKLNATDMRYYARKLSVVELSQKFTYDFLEANHRQGYMTSSIRLGLKSGDGTIVSVMTFNKPRVTIGKKSTDNEDTWELGRFCSLLNTSVVGGASKLLKYFITHFQVQKIISFSDVARSSGSLYETLGFTKVSCSDPGYVWSNLDDTQYYTRVACQKKNLRKLFHDDSIDIENKTEKQIMEEHGFVQVFDSGVIRWELDVTAE